MNTKNIFKVLALAMLMPTMLLTTACSNEDDVVVNNETTNKKGYPLQVTVNVTREDGDATRASFDGSKLNFSTGDKLFVRGSYNDYYNGFAGTLDYDAESGKFKGTIYTEDDTYKTYEDLFGHSDDVTATLLPAGYEDHGYLVIKTNDPDAQYDDYVEESNEYTLATSKADGVAQFSYEEATEYDNGFALSPDNAILNFTITGLAASTSVNVSLTSIAYNITGTVPTDASGTATFAAGISYGLNLQPFSLTVAGNPITLVSSDKLVEAGKIYNISMGTGATVDLSTKSTAYTAQNGETLTGTLGAKVQISIADGATVILNNVTINGTNDSNWAGITCNGDATIILSGTNTVKGFYEDYPGIYVPENKTVTIQGTGSLTASSNGWAAGIGGGNTGNCGNITITGGNITATGGSGRAGIGGGSGACGNITITGGTITATGGNNAAGIGGGTDGTCGNITITSGVTRVTATKGNYAPNSIGAGGDGTCGTVTIGGTVYPDGVTTSPFTYPAPAPSYTMAAAATTSDKGKLICTAGHIHVYGEDAACTADRVAKIIYVGTNGHATYNHGLALALQDMSTKLTWDNSGTNNDSKTAAEWCSAWNTSTTVTDAEWLLASKDQWDYMIGTNGAGSYTDLRVGFTSVGGTNMLKGHYWSSTEDGTDNAWDYYFGTGGDWWSSDKDYNNYNVRACLAF